MGNEKKAGYGAREAVFGIEYTGSNGLVFLTINKFKSPGKFYPVYKSETKSRPYNYDIEIDTDTLCDANLN